MLENLRFIAEICKNVYQSTLPVDPRIRASKMYQNAETDCQMYLIELIDKNEFIIAFRGSDSNLDWRYNCKFKLYSIPKLNIKVHRGFYTQYKSLEHIITEYIEINNLEKAKFMIMGHSLGGAVASICSLLLKKRYPELKVKCYTFGSPRAGNTAFAELHKELIPETLRIVNNNDPVTMVPTPIFYRHVGILVLLRQKKIESTYKYLKEVCKSTKRILFAIITCNPSSSPVYEHDIDEYIDKIEHLVN